MGGVENRSICSQECLPDQPSTCPQHKKSPQFTGSESCSQDQKNLTRRREHLTRIPEPSPRAHMNPKTIFFLILIFGCAGSSLLGFFLVAVSAGLPSTCGVQASHCNDFSCCRAWVLGHTGSGAHGLGSCSSWALEHRLNSCGPWS